MTRITSDQVSCVIPYAGAVKYLAEVVGSALAQQFYEVIIVNDGFPPNQLDIVASRSGVRIIHLPKPVGCPNARNLGIKSTATPYVVLLDHDDVLCDGYLNAISSWVTKYKARCAGATFRYIGENSKRIGMMLSRSPNFVLPSGFFSEVSLIAEVGYFPDSYSDDLLFFHALKETTRLNACPDAGVLYRIHPDAESSRNTKTWWAFNRLLPEYECGTYSLAAINTLAREYATQGKIPPGMEQRFQHADSPAVRFVARSAYACWLNRDVAGLIKYGGRLMMNLPSLARLAKLKWSPTNSA